MSLAAVVTPVSNFYRIDGPTCIRRPLCCSLPLILEGVHFNIMVKLGTPPEIHKLLGHCQAWRRYMAEVAVAPFFLRYGEAAAHSLWGKRWDTWLHSVPRTGLDILVWQMRSFISTDEKFKVVRYLSYALKLVARIETWVFLIAYSIHVMHACLFSVGVEMGN